MKAEQLKKGPAKITHEEALLYRPTESEISACEGEFFYDKLDTACQKVGVRALEALPRNSTFSSDPLRSDAEYARKTICLIRRACPVSDHVTAQERVALPCSGILYQIEDFLGVQRGGEIYAKR